MEVTTQPKAYAQKDFQTSLLSCCDDMGVCCCGTFCLPCLGCTIASDMNECWVCGLGMPIRSVYRTRYNIPVSMMSIYRSTN
ncbi:placenta-specific 8 [Triplophysa rosa]|uniref:Placenta-specific 8 n=1 Tax=Triplophysa rosa TaxID=992332 RepID=A0A9W7T7A0_TRIRA|nr:placenta-specific 8 [Triplophysa rosa]